MTVKTTLSFTDRHHAFLQRQVEQGIYATTSSAIAAAVENMIQSEEEFRAHVSGLAELVKERLKTPIEEYLDAEDVYRELMSELDGRKSA